MFQWNGLGHQGRGTLAAMPSSPMILLSYEREDQKDFAILIRIGTQVFNTRQLHKYQVLAVYTLECLTFEGMR
jgi:hypothetical protein